MPEPRNISTIICGLIYRETIINQLDQVSEDHPGGGALYAAAGHALFNQHIGIVAKVNPAFLDKFSSQLTLLGFDISGIVASAQLLNAMKYYRILSQDKWEITNMKRHFYELGYSIPRFLLEYDEQTRMPYLFKEPHDVTLLSTDIPQGYLPADNVLLMQLNFPTHFACVPTLKNAGAKKILMRSSPSYMCPGKLTQISKLLDGIDYFFTTEQEIRTLFKARFDHYWIMLDIINKFGAANIIIKNVHQGYLLLQRDSQQVILIPEYNGLNVDPIGIYDCFCGAFTACLTTGNFSVEECAVHASAAASICKEGSGITYILDSHRTILKLRAELMMSEINSVPLTSLSNETNGGIGF